MSLVVFSELWRLGDVRLIQAVWYLTLFLTFLALSSTYLSCFVQQIYGILHIYYGPLAENTQFTGYHDVVIIKVEMLRANMWRYTS